MAEPIRTYTPRRDVREELRRNVESAPIDHADAVLAAYELLQEAQDHGVLDTLRGAIGGGEAIISKASEYANTPEGVRLMRNLLAMTRLLGELDPSLLHAATETLSRRHREESEGAPRPSVWRVLQKLTSEDSRRTLAMVVDFAQTFGSTQNSGGVQKQEASGGYSRRSALTAPVIAVGIAAVVASFWIGRHS